MKAFVDIIRFDADRIADALGVSPAAVIDLYQDGRPASFLFKARIVADMGMHAGERNDPFDLVTRAGERVWRRVLTDNGVAFAPNTMIGVGRSFNEDKFLERLQDVDGFIVCDASTFPSCIIRGVSSRNVLGWHYADLLQGGHMRRSRFIALFNELELRAKAKRDPE